LGHELAGVSGQNSVHVSTGATQTGGDIAGFVGCYPARDTKENGFALERIEVLETFV